MSRCRLRESAVVLLLLTVLTIPAAEAQTSVPISPLQFTSGIVCSMHGKPCPPKLYAGEPITLKLTLPSDAQPVGQWLINGSYVTTWSYENSRPQNITIGPPLDLTAPTVTFRWIQGGQFEARHQYVSGNTTHIADEGFAVRAPAPTQVFSPSGDGFYANIQDKIFYWKFVAHGPMMATITGEPGTWREITDPSMSGEAMSVGIGSHNLKPAYTQTGPPPANAAFVASIRTYAKNHREFGGDAAPQNGTYSWIQTLTDVEVDDNALKPWPFYYRMPQPAERLDERAPFNERKSADSPPVQDVAIDSVSAGVNPTAKMIHKALYANMYLLWRKNEPGAIDVPLGHIAWGLHFRSIRGVGPTNAPGTPGPWYTSQFIALMGAYNHFVPQYPTWNAPLRRLT